MLSGTVTDASVGVNETFTVASGADYVINVNTTLSKRGLYNAAVLWPWSPYATTADTTRYNYDYHQFGIHDGKTNEYLYTGFILQSDKH